MSHESIFYVYQYVTIENIPYYIGKGKGKRINAKHTHTIVPDEEFRKYVKIGLSEVEALELEITLIRLYGRKVDGGLLDNIKLNQWACTSGWHHSDETREKISKSKLGVEKSNSTKEKMRKPKTLDHAEKIRQANLGRPYDPVRAAKISATLKARNKAIKELVNG